LHRDRASAQLGGASAYALASLLSS
jgi:hypothetical protein